MTSLDDAEDARQGTLRSTALTRFRRPSPRNIAGTGNAKKNGSPGGEPNREQPR